ncbi:hypothetical protein BDR05DRAFT_506500 [Suillus weaverae]|nr:hypothetical protein BDR05DRAFT_506500 [Suillus weaverae]
MHSSAGCPHSSALNPTPAKESNFRNAQVVIVLSKLLQYGTSRLWLLLGVQNTRKRYEHISNKPNRTAKPRRRHRTLSLPMLQHPRRLLLHVLTLPQQVQQPHSHHPYHGGLRSCCFSAVHLHHTPMVIDTVSVAALGQQLHLCF